ncbi:UDP-N-acetylmuramoyl-L-alanyl-D-glutamate--2,6-diaminopimelate ligase [Methylovirgula sp. HY1]|uniref:UDP-N-acetylmuramoyl-L-alanyl-D-glutamate--2, 6-diaminopimelate ligase n=1 Tax=Methylovirgula sp. HY1 TaxID=2822761 RepID=UPI001C5BEB00|nr:UDP-N-acetylmuramoyl-L-alanyl-D-glutamate--2,6-diaminopimelate ligase [Methylovirgula sp. HY1]QXX74555.1 UDP-N-acetylmuramoyl-L-alanyl-D-glutamate--2,6-diaminopimelate ligase [Methylovirgula sp. HY1]
MRLADLLPESDLTLAAGDSGLGCDVTGLSSDSRKVIAGAAFFALSGSKADGRAFIAEAVARGAAAVIAETAPEAAMPGVAFVKVADARRALALAAARFFARQPETIAAITGTSGKTSVSVFVRQIWQALGYRAASLGTIGLVAPSNVAYGALTTPDPVTLHETLAGLAADGVTHLALEASSHGLDQRRLDGLHLAAAAFTNLSRDHLDYHADLDAYLAAKLRLFEVLLPVGRPAVIDADSDVAERVEAVCTSRGLDVLTVGRRGAVLRLVEARQDDLATALTLAHGGRRHSLRLPLSGDFQVQNALVAAGLALATGGAPDTIFAALEKLEGVPGRLELVGRYRDAPIFVDYAHKPDALDKVLRSLRPLIKGRLIAVFGCGGDRDQGKRPIMGELAARLADVVIITDDNPRSEAPAAIRGAIREGASRVAGANLREIGDRGTAIVEAIALLAPGDALLIAGKGHETGQIVGDKVLPFSDQQSVRAALKDFAA